MDNRSVSTALLARMVLCFDAIRAAWPNRLLESVMARFGVAGRADVV